MLQNNSFFTLKALAVLGLATLSLASPLENRSADASPNIQVCTGSAGVGCGSLPISSDSCINFTGGLSFLNKEVSGAVVPAGFICTFYSQFGCVSAQGGQDTVILSGGTWTFNNVTGTNFNSINFNDQPSSFICTPA
ncbi:hypothetical protein CPC08DRAFT_727889 [Agrocybe pediades]|nr:hypothetical protein CPC08DRAFT_727889 [Agrocybe pediades]